MYEDLERSQERGLPERLAWSVVIPSLLVTLLLQGLRSAAALPPPRIEIPIDLVPTVEVDWRWNCPMVARQE